MRTDRSRGLRATALAVLLAIPATGGGAPVCLSVLHQASDPCPMHAQDQHTARDHAEHDSWGPVGLDHDCHPPDTPSDCGALGACPSASSAAPAECAPAVEAGGIAQNLRWATPAELTSFLAPPLPPPPQA